MSFEAFKEALGTSESRRELLFQDGRPFHVLLSQQFARDDLEQLSDTATSIRRLDRHRDGREFLRGVLRGIRVMNLFAQPSKRLFVGATSMAAPRSAGGCRRIERPIQVGRALR